MNLTNEQIDALKKNIENGYVRVAEHPTLPLKIYNYTPKAQFENEWNPITRMCRGLVLDSHYNIIIKCPEKFFNVGEPLAAKVDLLNARISDKLDGYYISCKIDSDYGLIITSRGSFENKYTQAAREFITDEIIYKMPTDYTYFCELLQDFPGDESIILTKHPDPDLVCWAIKDQDFNEIIPDKTECPFSIARELSLAEAKQYLEQKVEGVVAQDTKTFERVKIKTDWYLQNHRLISDCTKKRVWELLFSGQKIKDLDIPDEFMPQMQTWEQELLYEYEMKMIRIGKACERTEHFSDKELALDTRFTPEMKSYIFAWRKKPDFVLSEMVWKSLKPKNDIIE